MTTPWGVGDDIRRTNRRRDKMKAVTRYSVCNIKEPHHVYPQPQLLAEREVVELHPHVHVRSGAEQRVR